MLEIIRDSLKEVTVVGRSTDQDNDSDRTSALHSRRSHALSCRTDGAARSLTQANLPKELFEPGSETESD